MRFPRDVSGVDAIAALQRLGFRVVRLAGSHVRMAKSERLVTVPMHRSIALGTLQSILKQSGLSIDEFVRSL